MSDFDNLPVPPSTIPGWSKKDAAMDRAGEDERIASAAYDLEQVVRKLRATEGQDLDYTEETLVRSGETLEEVQSTLDDCRHILTRMNLTRRLND